MVWYRLTTSSSAPGASGSTTWGAVASMMARFWSRDDPVQTVRIAGTVDLFDALALLLGGLGQMLHQGGCRIPARF